MSFVGAIPAAVRKFVGNHGHIFDGRLIINGCAGNFTVEQLITKYSKNFYMHSNDISIYSSFLGAYLTDQDLKMDIKPGNEELNFLRDYMNSPEEKATLILMFSSLIKHYQQNTEYRKRLWKHYVNNFPVYFAENREALRKWKDSVKVDKYSMMDVYDLYKNPPKEAILLSFLPTYTGGYEKLYIRLNKAFKWPEPSYQMLDEQRAEDVIKMMAERDYVYFTDNERRELGSPVMIAKKIQYRTIYIYSNLPFKKSITRRRISSKIVYFRLFGSGDEIKADDKITLHEIDTMTMNYYRDVYLAKNVGIPSISEASYAVAINGKVFGFVGFNRVFDRSKDWAKITLLCDFVVPSKKYKRLSKLMLLIVCSKEVRRILEEKYLQAFTRCYTSVFTDKPVSMKYRGIFKLVERKTDPPRLKYGSKMGKIKLEEVIPLWLKKYEKS